MWSVLLHLSQDHIQCLVVVVEPTRTNTEVDGCYPENWKPRQDLVENQRLIYPPSINPDPPSKVCLRSGLLLEHVLEHTSTDESGEDTQLESGIVQHKTVLQEFLCIGSVRWVYLELDRYVRHTVLLQRRQDSSDHRFWSFDGRVHQRPCSITSQREFSTSY